MKILFYIEPFIENSNPSFRVPTITKVIFPLIATLGDSAKYCLVSSDKTLNLINEIPSNISCYGIKEEVFLKIFDNSLDYACDMQNQRCDSTKIELLKNELSSQIQFEPDVVFNYESCNSFLLKQVFPKAKVVDMMFGPFSRVPYPTTTFLDLNGIYQKSSISNITPRELNKTEKNCLAQIRRRTALCLAENLPCKKLINDLKVKFKKLIIVACQIDSYFGFKACSEYKNSIEIVKETIKQTPSDIGIIVTGHSEYELQYSKSEISDLSAKHPNVIFLDTQIPFISQWILPYCDAVVTTSSSVGYQAALWKKLLILTGKSQLSSLAHGYLKNNDLEKLITKDDIQDLDSVIYDILSKYTLWDKFDLKDSSKLLKIIGNIIDKNSINIDRTPEELSEAFISSFRGLMLKQLFEKEKIKTEVDHLRANIAKHEYISFDVFDTLIDRPLIEPWHIFVLIEEKVKNFLHDLNFNFVYFRRLAEANVRRNAGVSVEVTVEEIYQEFQELTGLSTEQISHITEIELNAELSFCSAKRLFKQNYEFVRLLNLPLYIISDIYLHTETIEKILTKSGYKGWTKLYCSADTKVRKHDGKLFAYVLKDNNITDSSLMLHIGDNQIADFNNPKSYGIHSYLCPTARKQYQNSLINTYLNADYNRVHLAGSIVSGTIMNRFFSNSGNTIAKEQAFNGDPFLLGYAALGPMILGFIQWVHRKAKIHDDQFLYFLARDGWLPRQAYNLLYEEQAIPNKYLYASRRCVSVPSIENIDDVYELAFQSFDARTIDDFLNARFGLTSEDIPQEIYSKNKLKHDSIITPTRNMKQLRSFLLDSYEIIKSKSEAEKESLLKYFEQENLVENLNKSKVGFIDIGYSGSMQRFITKLLKTTNIDGYYLLTHFFSRHRHKNEVIEGYLCSEDDHKNYYRHKLNDYVFIFESLLSSPEGSITNFELRNNSLVKNFIFEAEETNRISLLNKIHAGAIEFIKDIKRAVGTNYLNEIEIPSSIAESFILAFAKNPSKIDSSIFFNIGVENTFGGGSVCLIEKSCSKTPKEDEVTAIINRSKWKEGAKVYYLKQKVQGTIVNTPQKVNSNNVTLDIKQRKIIKLKNTPQKFFLDSKNVFLNIIGKIGYTKITRNNLGKLITYLALKKMNR